MSRRAELVARYDFDLDEFQRRSHDVLDAGQSVLVAAPTASGKTVVAEYAIDLALEAGRKAFYTTPIKALSNQKYSNLVRRLGAERVGLLTGDNAVNGDAPVVVMTTEILRNMIYGGSPALRNLRYVILDEVHYLQDAYRGPVWEEVIIHLPASVLLVCLSATVSNAEELTEWISTVRGPTAAVVEARRPVELLNLYLVGDKSSPDLHVLPTLVDGRPNPEASRLDAESLGNPRLRCRPRRRYFTPRRVEVVDRLADDDLLPAIYFIFSRAACDDAVTACVDAGLRLTTPDERIRIRVIVEARTATLSDADIAVLGYGRWLTGLELGIAAHHAGMVPPFKETVEACFAEGLVKVVFATETLALGINMPARSVVIEKLSKFTGERHEFLTPGEYTQVTGRAGRRGIDPVGHAVVLWSPFVPFDQVAALASSRTFRLRSAFRPTYTMAANLVQRYPADQAHHLLNLSFAQYQADRSVVASEARLEKRQATLAALVDKARCDRGDVDGYREAVTAVESVRRRASSPRAEVERALERLRPGDVIEVPTGRRMGRAAVLTYANRRDSARLRVITANRKVYTLGLGDLDTAPTVLGHLELPAPYAPNNHGFQQQVARALQQARLHRTAPAAPEPDYGDALARATAALRAHPVHGCPERDEHVRAANRAERIRGEIADIERSIRGRTESLARRFDRVLRVLEAWGYLEGWALTDKGERLRRIYHECDLLIAECVDTGVLDGLDAASLAGLVSCFTYEHRSAAPPPPPWFPAAQVRSRYGEIEALRRDLNADEQEAGLPLTRPPDAEFFALAHAWAAGEDLDEILEEEVSGGDFVRNVKQLIDLLRQLADVVPVAATAAQARRAADGLYRGVVSASSALAAEDDEAATVADPEHVRARSPA
ncbi:DEAD/DEAH box helicase [soil metagenome]